MKWSIGLTSLPNNKILAWAKLREFSDDKMNVGLEMMSVYDSEEILGEQEKMPVTNIFYFSHHVVKSFLHQDCLTLNHKILSFNDHEEGGPWKKWEKETNAGNQHFVLLLQSFLPFQRQQSSF